MTAADREAVRRQRHHARAAADRRRGRAGPAVSLQPVRRGSGQRPRPVPRPRAHRAAGAPRAGRRRPPLRRAHRSARDEGDVSGATRPTAGCGTSAGAGATWPARVRPDPVDHHRTHAGVGLEAQGFAPAGELPLEAAGLGLVVEDRVAGSTPRRRPPVRSPPDCPAACGPTSASAGSRTAAGCRCGDRPNTASPPVCVARTTPRRRRNGIPAAPGPGGLSRHDAERAGRDGGRRMPARRGRWRAAAGIAAPGRRRRARRR